MQVLALSMQIQGLLDTSRFKREAPLELVCCVHEERTRQVGGRCSVSIGKGADLSCCLDLLKLVFNFLLYSRAKGPPGTDMIMLAINTVPCLCAGAACAGRICSSAGAGAQVR